MVLKISRLTVSTDGGLQKSQLVQLKGRTFVVKCISIFLSLSHIVKKRQPRLRHTELNTVTHLGFVVLYPSPLFTILSSHLA